MSIIIVKRCCQITICESVLHDFIIHLFLRRCTGCLGAVSCNTPVAVRHQYKLSSSYKAATPALAPRCLILYKIAQKAQFRRHPLLYSIVPAAWYRQTTLMLFAHTISLQCFRQQFLYLKRKNPFHRFMNLPNQLLLGASCSSAIKRS